MPDVIGFLPSERAFRFSNDWPSIPDKTIATPLGPIAIGDASNGLCGGMVFAVRDYFEANIMCPSGRRPGAGHPLFDYIVDRLIASFDLPHGPAKYLEWMNTPGHNTWFRTGLAQRTIVDEWPTIKAELDSNHLSCVALVTQYTPNPGDMGHNHQVLAYGYDLTANQQLTLKVYDPNAPGNNAITLSLSLATPSRTTTITHNVNVTDPRTDQQYPIRGFFHVPYTPASPPQFDDAAIEKLHVPLAPLPGTTDQVSLRVTNTGTTTWASGGATPYRLGSQRPQDNTIWGPARVALPHAVSPTQLVTLSFPVQVPLTAGQRTMGWQMVKEHVRWSGDLEAREVWIGSTLPADPCEQLRRNIQNAQTEIATLQAEYHTAAGDEKAFITSQINRLKVEVNALRRQAVVQGCAPLP